MHTCKICHKGFLPKNDKKPPQTCSKVCKNDLARLITNKQFSDPANREIQRQRSIEQKQDPLYWEKVKVSMAARTKRYSENGHPRTGMSHPESAKEAISKANTGRFKGKTWDEIFGKEVAARRRVENAISMAAKNEILLKEKLLPYLPDYENNIRVSKYNVDFLNSKTSHIIEVYGNYWHCNPSIYADDFYHTYFRMSAKDRRKLDEDRIKYLESKGYSVTIVWESDLNEFIKGLVNVESN